MKNIYFLFLVSFLIGSTILGNSKNTYANSDIGVAVVEVQLIMRESLAARSIHTQIEETRSIYEAEVLREETRLQELKQEIARQRSLLEPDAFTKRTRNFESQVTEHKRNVRERRRVLDKAYEGGVRQLQITLAKIIAEIARDKGVLMVLPASTILFGERSLLLTSEVLSTLNERLPAITLTIPSN